MCHAIEILGVIIRFMGQFVFLNENNVARMSSNFKSNAAYSGEFAPIKLHYGS